jgi:hypothetical protein
MVILWGGVTYHVLRAQLAKLYTVKWRTPRCRHCVLVDAAVGTLAVDYTAVVGCFI